MTEMTETTQEVIGTGNCPKCDSPAVTFQRLTSILVAIGIIGAAYWYHVSTRFIGDTGFQHIPTPGWYWPVIGALAVLAWQVIPVVFPEYKCNDCEHKW